MALRDRYLSGGGSIRWRKLGVDLAGSLFLTMAAIASSVWLTVGDVISGLLGGLAGFNSSIVEATIGTPGDAIGATAAAAVAFVGSFGPLAFPAAVVIVSAGLFLIAKVTDDAS